VKNAPAERCCGCGEWHRAGIYLRANPAELLCKGKHIVDAAEVSADTNEEGPNLLALQVGGRIVTIPLDEEGDLGTGSLATYVGLEPHEVEPFVRDVLTRVLSRVPAPLPRVTVAELDARELSADEAKEGYALRDKVAELVGGPFVLVVPYDDPKRAGWASRRGAQSYSKGFDGASLATLFAGLLRVAEVTNLPEGVAVEVSVRGPRGDA
jgi:hypothetical protein